MIDPLQDPQRPESWSVDAVGYDAAFAPFTSSFAADAVRMLEIGPTDHVLDIAAGSGAFTFAAAALGSRVLATDFAPGMVAVLRDRATSSGATNVTAEVMDGQALALDDDSFDVTCSMFGVMFFPDLDAGLHEFVRVTRAGGRMAMGVWDISSYRLPELIGRAARVAVPELEFGTPPPRAPRLGTPDSLAETLAALGWADVAVQSVEHPLVLADPAAFLLSIPGWSAPLRPLFDQIPDHALPTMANAFAEFAAECGGGTDDVRIPWTAHIGTGTAP